MKNVSGALKRKNARPGSLAALDRRRHYRRRPTRRSRHQHRRRSRAPSSAPEPANNNPPKKKCRRRPAAAAPPSRPVQVGLRQGSQESAPASRAREGSEYGQRFFQTTNRSIGRSLELPHRPPPAPTTSSPPRNQKRNRPLRRQGQIPTALGSASRARETTQSMLTRLATDTQKLDQLSGATQ